MNPNLKTTVVVSPRERFIPLIPSLKSLFSTIDKDVPVVVVDGGAPKHICSKIKELKHERPFEWINNEFFITPNEARNIGFKKVNTEFVAFVDNDIHYESGWLSALEKNATQNNSDIVAPLICIGPPKNKVVHHAGGKLVARKTFDDKLELNEKHRFMNEPVSELQKNAPSVENEVTEFHCFLARSECVREFGPLDERLITREQMDFALRALVYGKKVTFENSSVVTYMANDKFEKNDLDYLLFRWNETLARQSISAFCESWDVSLDTDRILHSWIAKHRMRAIASAYNRLNKIMPNRIFKNFAKIFIENPRTAKAFLKRNERKQQKPLTIEKEIVSKTLESIPIES